jgi:RNA polymerase sigma-54 factor
MELRLRQHLALTPQLQQALRLLQLSALEFAQEMEQALNTNPFLEDDPDAPLPTNEAGGEATTTTEAAPTSTQEQEYDDPAEARFGSESEARPAHDGDESDWTDWTEAQPTLREHLRRQLLISQMGERDRALAHFIIDALDEDGFLTTPLEELAALIPAEHDVEPSELSASLRLVQQLEPAGVAARSLQECLLLQLQALEDDSAERRLAITLVRDHLPLLANREFIRLQQLLACDEHALHSARTLIRSLDPRPGRRYGPDNARYVIPDVLVMKQRGRWIAVMNRSVLPRIKLNRAYADMLGRRNGGSPLSRQLQEARWLIRNMEQRYSTIQRVADAIVAKQRNFFEYGDVAMKPLALRDIATELKLHESTVCRVTNGKYMATPRGLYEFKHFFSRQLATDNGGACSPTAIRAVLKEMIATEDPKEPLSDAQLARLLAQQGLRVARRTVTKYRALLKVPSVELRRVQGRTLLEATA